MFLPIEKLPILNIIPMNLLRNIDASIQNYVDKPPLLETIKQHHKPNKPPSIYKGDLKYFKDYVKTYSMKQTSLQITNKPPKGLELLELFYQSPFIPIDIIQWIETRDLYVYKYYYLQYDIEIFTENKETLPDLKIINSILYLFETFKSLGPAKIRILMCGQKKILPQKRKPLTPIEINSGSTHTGKRELLVFRSEELYKVLIHELVHLQGLDSHIKHNGKLKDCVNRIEKFTGFDHCVESYTEFIAVVLYSLIISRFYKKSWKKLFKNEIAFSILQSCKIRNHYNNSTIEQYTSVVSYYLIKTRLLLDSENLIPIFDKYLLITEDDIIDSINKVKLPNQCDFLNRLNKHSFLFRTLRLTIQ